MRRLVASALARLRTLFQVRLGAVPLLAYAQCAILWQVYATVCTTHHWRGVGLTGPLLFGGRAFEFAPEPYCGSNDGNPEQ